MIQGRGCLSFLNEPALALWIGDFVGRQKLYRHEAIEPRVARLVDHAHAALTKLFLDSVVGDGLAYHGLISRDHTTEPVRLPKRAGCAT